MTSGNSWRVAVTSALVATVCACGPKVPEGQVVAVVNGEEVTRRELTVEPEAAGLAAGDNAQPALRGLLDGVIDRKLAVAEARRLGLDRTPEYVSQAKRLDEVLLSRSLFDQWANAVPAPSAAAINAYAANHPQSFAGRKLLLVDRLDMPTDAMTPADLGPMQSIDEIAALAQGKEKPFRRQRTVMDTATMPLALYRQLLAVAPGYPVAMPQGAMLVALAVVESRDAPPSAQERSDLATKAIRQAAVRQKLSGLRSKAKVAYQAGYRPAPGDVAKPGDSAAVN